MIKKTMFLEIMSLAYEINTTTNHHVFVEYAPHVNRLDVRIYKDGWIKGKDAEVLTTYPFESKNKYLPTHKTIYEIANLLKELLKNG